MDFKNKRKALDKVFEVWNVDLYNISEQKADHEDFKADIINALCVWEKKASELNTKALPLHGVVFSGMDCKYFPCFNGGEMYCDHPKCSQYEKNEAEVCPLCNNTGEYHFGGSFGGSVQIQKCNCGRT